MLTREDLLDEARAIAPHTITAEDGLSIAL